MRSVKICLLSFLIFCSPFSYSNEASSTIKVAGNESYPPSSWVENGTTVGVAAELLDEIFRDSDVKLDHSHLGPWKRVQKLLKNGKADIITTLYKTTEREQYLQYIDEPYMSDANVIWVHKDNTFAFNQWSDLIGKRGLSALGDSYGEDFDQYTHKHLTMNKVRSPKIALKMISAKRRDFFIYGRYTGEILLRQLGLESQIIPLPKPLLTEYLYFAFSKKSNHLNQIPFIEKRLRELKNQGFIDQLIETNINNFSRTQD